MLILTRRVGESVRIGKDIRVSVVSVRKNQVRIGFEAPSSSPVYREEIWVKKSADPDFDGEVIVAEE